MNPGNPREQLELFELAQVKLQPQPHRQKVGRVVIQLRHDQFLVAVIAMLMTSTVVFAFGVARGKQFVRSERLILARNPRVEEQHPVVQQGNSTTNRSEVKSQVLPAEKSESTISTPLPKRSTEPLPVDDNKGRYAVQVVTYSKPQLASRELQRLQTLGEDAFLVTRSGRTVLYVGPFPSKANARQKQTELKTRYQDCFVKTL